MEDVKTLYLMCGLPRSGKSTYARKVSAAKGWPIVCPDSVRLALHGQVFLEQQEPLVWYMVRVFINSLFLSGHTNVILDATNTTLLRRHEWWDKRWVQKILYMPTTLSICIERAKQGGREDLIPVITQMYKRFQVPEGQIVTTINNPETLDDLRTE